MKVKLAVQVFSTSVTDALEYCVKDQGLQQFKHSEATVTFCRTVDKLFDIFNTRNFLSKNSFRRPLSNTNFSFIKSFFDENRKYILGLKSLEGEELVYSKRKKGFLGLLINMTSIESIVQKFVVEKKYLSYLLTYKLSQDHIETFFCAIRSRGGFNNNPTASQFEAAYKRLLIHAEITSKSSANCLPQDDTYILNIASTASSKKKIDYMTDNVDRLDDGELNFDIDEILINEENHSQYVNDVVIYICGFIVKKLKLKINCSECCSQLETNTSFSKLISRKDKGGLVKPSANVINVCKIAETIFRTNRNYCTGNVILKLIYLTKEQLNLANIFPDLSNHILDQDPLNNHLLQMINLILKYYFTIRLHHKNMQINEVKDRIRHKYSKLITFKNQ
ncbi:hypothetical protein Zmor_006169 [Zophobas morio]|uniref:THAP domain-containing protein 9 n=1 Tax=Zophobas morio TaxID=2755281 RepID=A0AA38IR86_9CUCU|nr:hypothetical protein Zmor_006169 [Zophobas morio]